MSLPPSSSSPLSPREFVPGSGERPPYVRLLLLPAPTAGPFSSKVRLVAPFRSGEAVFEAQCFGIRSE